MKTLKPTLANPQAHTCKPSSPHLNTLKPTLANPQAHTCKPLSPHLGSGSTFWWGSWRACASASASSACHALSPTPYTLHPTPFTLHPAPHTPHPTPHTSHLTPHTPHYTPFSLQPAPYTLNPKPHTIHFLVGIVACLRLGVRGQLVTPSLPSYTERSFFVDNLLVRIPFTIEMIWWTGLAPWKFEFLFSSSMSTFPSHTPCRVHDLSLGPCMT